MSQNPSVVRSNLLRYSDSDRVIQLDALVSALDALVAHLPSVADFADSTDTFRQYCDAVRALITAGYTQSDLNDISSAFPAIIHTHPDWVPPLIQTPGGGFSVPPWFPELERLHIACTDAAGLLRLIGEY